MHNRQSGDARWFCLVLRLLCQCHSNEMSDLCSSLRTHEREGMLAAIYEWNCKSASCSCTTTKIRARGNGKQKEKLKYTFYCTDANHAPERLEVSKTHSGMNASDAAPLDCAQWKCLTWPLPWPADNYKRSEL